MRRLTHCQWLWVVAPVGTGFCVWIASALYFGGVIAATTSHSFGLPIIGNGCVSIEMYDFAPGGTGVFVEFEYTPSTLFALPRRWFCLTPPVRTVKAPAWLIALVTPFASLLAYRRIVRQVPPGRCARCGYDLRGITSSRCPECGASVHVAVRDIATSRSATPAGPPPPGKPEKFNPRE